MAKTRKKTVKVKKKLWIRITAPEFLQKQEIGESYVESPENLVGKHVKVNLVSLTNDYKKQKYGAEFIVTRANTDEARTRICGFRTRPLTLKTMVRKGHDRVDHRITLETADKEQIILKPILITKNNVPHSVQTNLRKAFDELIAEKVKKLKADEVFSNLISLKLQRELRKELGKVYPLKALEVKIASLVLDLENVVDVEPEAAAVEEEEEEPDDLFDDDLDKEEE